MVMLFAVLTLSYFWQNTGRNNTAAVGIMKAMIKSVSETNCNSRQHQLSEEYVY